MLDGLVDFLDVVILLYIFVFIVLYFKIYLIRKCEKSLLFYRFLSKSFFLDEE